MRAVAVGVGSSRSSRARPWAGLALAVILVLVGVAPARAEPVTISLGSDALHLEPLALPGLERGEKSDDGPKSLKAWWRGEIGEDKRRVTVEVWAFPKAEYYLSDPEDVCDYLGDWMRMPDRDGDLGFKFDHVEIVKGKFGWLPYASLATGGTPNAKEPTGELLALCGVLETYAYVVRVRATPRLAEPERTKALEFLRRSVTSTGAVEDPKWSAAELRARWDRDVTNPKTNADLKPPTRTKHYVILTNSGAGALFSKKMEACYDQIQKTYPFPEADGRRLLPVFLFKDRDEYNAFYAKVREVAVKDLPATKGHAWKDYYATYYDSPNDPVHIHEATHQLFRNRLHLGGCGSWFQEGVAEYICTSSGERKTFARNAARNAKFIPFTDLIRMRSLLSGLPPINGSDAYLEAASLIEFLREDKRYADKFQLFLHEMGVLGYDDAADAEQKLKDVYSIDFPALEKEWVKANAAR